MIIHSADLTTTAINELRSDYELDDVASRVMIATWTA